MVVGGTQSLTAVTKDANNNTLTGRTVSWVSSNTAVLTVSPASSTNGTTTVTAVGVGTATITATSETKTATTPSITVNPVPVVSVTLSAPTTPSIRVQKVGQVLTASPKDAGGNTLSGRTVSWVSSNTAVLTVSAASSVSTSSGATVTVTAVGTGTATITATSEAAPALTTPSITVDLAPVNSVILSSPTTPMVVGGTQTLTAVTKDAANNVLTGRTVSWVSSNTSVLTVSPASSTNGTTTVTAVGVGTATITATSETKTATTPVITVNPVSVATVTVTPTSATLVLGITPTQQLTAVSRDVADNVLAGRAVTWSSSDGAVATVDANGLVTAVAAGGPVTITATSEGKTATSAITVTPAPVATVTLSSPTTPMVVGGTQSLTAVTKDAANNTLTGRTVSWVSSNYLGAHGKSRELDERDYDQWRQPLVLARRAITATI